MAESSTIGRADLRVREALRFVAANAPQTIIAGILGAAVLVFLLRDAISLKPALFWLGAMLSVGTVRLVLRARVAQLPVDALAQRRHLQHFTIGAFVSGTIWASAPWVLDTGGDRTLQSMVLFACAAVATGGGFAALASLRTAFAVFWPPMLAPVLYGLLDGSRFYLIIGGIALVLSFVVSRMLLVLNRQFVEQVELRERNAELLLQLHQRTADAEAANEAKSRFLVAAGHDLRQPMHAIALRSRALIEQALPPAARTLAVRLDQSVSVMQGLFDTLLDISKLDAGAVQPLVMSFPLKTLFKNMAENYADDAVEQAVDLRVDATELWVASDALLLERIVRQLLDNAMRHAARSSVFLLARQAGDEVIIEVRDTGRGIPREQHQTIFKEFVQLENPQRDRRKGLGLGLAIVQRLARLLGHRLELESEHGHGACFRIFVPVAQPAIKPGSVAKATLLGTAPALHGLLIALLDDEPDVLDAMSTLLTHWRCEVIAATHSGDLADRLRRHARRPDLLICDYRLAEPRNGRQVIDYLRLEYGAQMPALLITGDIRAIEAAKDSRDISVLQKPVSPAALREIIAAHTGRSRASGAA